MLLVEAVSPPGVDKAQNVTMHGLQRHSLELELIHPSCAVLNSFNHFRMIAWLIKKNDLFFTVLCTSNKAAEWKKEEAALCCAQCETLNLALWQLVSFQFCSGQVFLWGFLSWKPGIWWPRMQTVRTSIIHLILNWTKLHCSNPSMEQMNKECAQTCTNQLSICCFPKPSHWQTPDYWPFPVCHHPVARQGTATPTACWESWWARARGRRRRRRSASSVSGSGRRSWRSVPAPRRCCPPGASRWLRSSPRRWTRCGTSTLSCEYSN